MQKFTSILNNAKKNCAERDRTRFFGADCGILTTRLCINFELGAEMDYMTLFLLTFSNFRQKKVFSPRASKRVPYYEVLGVFMAEWLTRSVFTQRARVRSRAKKSFF
jgi:hypothetical protein